MKATPVDLGTAIRDAVEYTRKRREFLARSCNCPLDVVVEVEELLPVLARSGELREIFTNLLLNAFDASQDGGTVRIDSASTSTHVTVTLKDKGSGMDAEVLANCRSPTFTTKGAEGTGLGPSMASLLVERFGGQITVESEVGRGSSVAITLPRAS